MTARILIVDDDVSLLGALREMLHLHVADIDVETDDLAAHALRRVEQGEYDVIVSDVRMPGMDGLAFVRHVSKIRPTTPTLLMTGQGDRDLAVQALDAGAYGFIAKPIDRQYFIAWLKRALQLNAVNREADANKVRLRQQTEQLASAVEQHRVALRANEERLSILLEATGVVPWEADASTWRFTYVGQQAVTLFGYPVEQWYGENFWVDHIHPDDREAAVTYCLTSSREKSHYSFEYRMVAADGRVLWVYDIVSTLHEDGELKALRGVMLDITERKQAEEQIRQLNRELQHRIQEFESLIHTAPIGIGVATGADCSFIWGNREFHRMLQSAEGENISKSGPGGRDLPFRIFSEGQELRPEDLPMQRACREGRNVFDQELEIARSDGSVLYELARATPLLDDCGKIRGCIGAFLDITERKRAEHVLREREHALRESEGRLRQTIAQLDASRAELQERVKELEAFHDVVVDRELRMIELKKEIVRLKAERFRTEERSG